MNLTDYARDGDAKGFEKEFTERIQKYVDDNQEHKDFEKEVYELNYLIKVLQGDN